MGMKFTFKTTKPTGRYRSFYNDYHEVKYKGVAVGTIADKAPFKITLMIAKKDVAGSENPNCQFENKTIKREFESIPQAKEWLNENIKKVLELGIYIRE